MKHLFKFIIVLAFTSMSSYANSTGFQIDATTSTISKELYAELAEIKGCWRNVETGTWDISFMEKFAIYDCKLWQYEHIKTKRNKTQLTLINGEDRLAVKVKREGDSLCYISFDKNKSISYELCKKVLGDYPTKDTTSLAHYPYKNDTVVFSGLIQASAKDIQKTKFLYYDLMTSNEVSFPIEADSNGYFSIKIPVINTQYIYFIGCSEFLHFYIEPDKRYFFFLDADSRQTLMMGDDARVQNELLTHSLDFPSNGYEKQKSMTTKEVLVISQNHFQQRKQIVSEIMEKHPTLSGRYRYFVDEVGAYDIAESMMIKRYSVKGGDSFSEKYMTFLTENFIDRTIYPKTISNSYSYFSENYVEQMIEGDLKMGTTLWIPPYDKIIPILEKEGLDTFTLAEKEAFNYYCNTYVDSISYYQFEKNDSIETAKYRLKVKPITEKVEKSLESHPLLNSKEDKYVAQIKFEAIKKLSDSDDFAQTAITASLLNELYQRQDILSPEVYELFLKCVSNEVFREMVTTIQKRYEENNKRASQIDNICSNEPLEGITDGKELLEKIIAPYKGKVIYLDAWGTWCAPCKMDMQYVGKIKEQLKDKDVVFLYLAFSSPEKSWRNAILEFQLNGKESAHYNLPEEQQRLLGKELSIKHYPTYILFDKEGNIAIDRAAKPSHGKKMIEQIETLLQK